MANVADFTTRFPEYAAVDPTRIQMFLDDTELLMADPSRWLSFYDVSQLYFTAHLLTVALVTESGDFGVLGPVKKQEVDDVMVEQAIGAIPPTAEDLNSTSYGKRYYHYRKLCFVQIVGV